MSKKNKSKKVSVSHLTKPKSHVPVGDLARMIGQFRALGYRKCSIRVRTVAFKLEGEWHNFATAGTLIDGSSKHEKKIELRADVVLIERSAPVTRIPSVEILRRWFFGWRQMLGSKENYPLQDFVYLTRHSSRQQGKRWPEWRTEIRESGRTHKSFPPPEGPFLHKGESLFAPSLPNLAALYLEDSHWKSMQSATDANVFVIQDLRVRLADVAIVENTIKASVNRNTSADLHLCASAVSHEGGEFREVVRIGGKSTAKLKFPFSPAELSIWITLADGYPLDSYAESLRRDAWAGDRGLLRKNPKSEAQKGFQAILRMGESDTVEFKPYISFKRPTEKRDELLQTVCGFANAKGGSIYVGVDNNAVPIGIELGLRDYNAECKAKAACLREKYLGDLKRLFADGITPSLPLDFEWHETAHHVVLEVKVPRSPTTVGLITGDTYERVGATNRKVLAHQIRRLKATEFVTPALGLNLSGE